MKILIINTHSIDNQGDAGIVLSMVDSLRDELGMDSKISITSRYWEKDKLFFSNLGIEVYPEIFEYPDSSINMSRRIIILLKQTFKLLRMRSKKQEHLLTGNKVFQVYSDVDIIISCGGGFILSNHSYLIEPSLVSHLFQILYGVWKSKKVIIYSQSIGPFKSSLSKTIVKYVLSKVHRIYIREKLSLGYLENLGIKEDLQIVADSAFSLKTKPFNLEKYYFLNSDKVVGVTLRQWRFPNKKEPDVLYNKYLDSLKCLIQYLIEEGYKIVLISQVNGPTPYEDDRNANTDLLSRFSVHNINEVHNIDSSDLEPGELKYVYSKLTMLIGTRMHSVIFALSSLVPTLAIAYEPKTTGVMHEMNLGNYVVDIDTISANELILKVNELLSNYLQYKQHLRTNIGEVISKSKTPSKNIKHILLGK